MDVALKLRIFGLFLIFSLLVVVSGTAIFWMKTTQQQNAMVITLADRQHILIEQMTGEALELEFDRDDQDQHIAALQEGADTFEQTLWALINGGPAPFLPNQTADVPATYNPDIQLQLHQVHHTWDVFRGHLNEIMAVDRDDPNFTFAIRAVERLSPKLLQEVDEVVSQYQAASGQEVVRFWWIEGVLFASVVAFIGVGYLVTERSLLNPLRTLEAVIERMKQGDLATPIKVTGGPREIEAIAHSLETMRTQLRVSQAELIAWTEKLESNVTQRSRELTAAFESSQEIISELNIDELLSSITDRARALTNAQAARLCLVDANGKDVVLAASSGNIAMMTDSQEPFAGQSTLHLVDISGNASVEMPCSNCAFPRDNHFGRCLAIPLRIGEQTIGALCVVKAVPENFDPDESRALTLLVNSAAIAIANAGLVETGRRHAEQVTVLAERERLAADLHDDLAQTLGFINLKVDQLREQLAADNGKETGAELDRLHKVLKDAHSQVRAALVNLRSSDIGADISATTSYQNSLPPVISGQALAEELESYLVDFRESSGLSVDLTITDPAELALPIVVRGQATYIVREALINAYRHAHAQHVWVRVEQNLGLGEVCFTVEDDGDGFDPDNIEGNNHFGLMIMRARAERSKGRLTIDSAPGAGTKVSVHFPLAPVPPAVSEPI